jgi:hypothetical protein
VVTCLKFSRARATGEGVLLCPRGEGTPPDAGYPSRINFHSPVFVITLPAQSATTMIATTKSKLISRVYWLAPRTRITKGTKTHEADTVVGSAPQRIEARQLVLQLPVILAQFCFPHGSLYRARAGGAVPRPEPDYKRTPDALSPRNDSGKIRGTENIMEEIVSNPKLDESRFALPR